MKSRSIDQTTLIAFIATVLLGGLNSLGIRFTVLELPPFWGAVLRFAPAALLLLVLTLALHLRLPTGKSLLVAVLFGVLSFGASFALVYWGVQKVQAGTAQVIFALVPLFTFLFAIVLRQEVFRWRALIGSLLAVGGISLVFGEQVQSNVPLLSLLALILSAVCVALGNVILKGVPMSHPIPTNVVSMGTGSVILFLISLIFQEPRVLPQKAATWAALVFLVLIGSCVVFILFLFVLNRWTASATSYTFVLFPFVAIAASALLDRERLSLWLLLGAVLVIAGVYIGAIGKLGEKPHANLSTLPTEENTPPTP